MNDPRNSESVDFSVVLAISEGDRPFEIELFTTYIDDCRKRLKTLRAAVTSADLEMLKHTAHTIKGASANVGARRLEMLAGEIEASLSVTSVSDADLVSQLEREFVSVDKAVTAFLSEG